MSNTRGTGRPPADRDVRTRRTTQGRSSSTRGTYSNRAYSGRYERRYGNSSNSRVSNTRRGTKSSTRNKRRNTVGMGKRIIAVVAIILLVGLAVYFFNSCSRNSVGDISVNTGESALYIESNGEIMYAMKESFDKAYYDKDSLEEAVETEISNFNAGSYASSGDSVKLDTFKVKDNSALVIISFDSISDYVNYAKQCNGYTEDEIFIGKVSQAIASGFEFDTEIYAVESGKLSDTAVDTATIKSYSGSVIIIKEQMKIQIEDKNVEYLSGNCTVKDGIVTVTDENTAYIVFK